MKTTTQRKEDQMVPDLPPFPSIHIIDSFSGGKGKSTFSRFLAHHLEYNEFNGVLFDADLKTTDGSVKGNISPVYPETIDLDIRTELGYGFSKANKQMIDCLRSGLNVFLNLPGSSFEFSSAWLRDSNLLDVRLKLSGTDYIYEAVEPEPFQDLTAGALAGEPSSLLNLVSDKPSLEDLIQGKQPRIHRWHLSGCTETDGQEFMAAVRYYDQLCPGRIHHILVRNEALLPSSLRIDWEPLYAVEGLSDLVCRNDIYTIDFPRLAQPEVDILNREKLTYAAAMARQDLTTTSRGRLYRFLRDTTIRITESGLMDNLVELTMMKPAEAYNPSNFKIGTRPSKAKSEPKSESEAKPDPKPESEAKSKAKPESKRKSRAKSKPKSEPQPKPEVDPVASEPNLSPPAVEADVQPANERGHGGMYRAENGDWMDDLSDPEDDSLTYDELGLGHDYEIVDADDPERLMAESSGVGLGQVSHSNGHRG
jgi:hypothetical protein